MDVPTPRAAEAPVAPASEPIIPPQPLPVFAYDDLLELLGGNDALLPELLSILREDAGVMVGDLRRAITDRAAEDVVDIAHTLKGMLGNVAGLAAADTAKRIEQLGREPAFDQATRELARLGVEVAQLMDAINDHIHQPIAQPA